MHALPLLCRRSGNGGRLGTRNRAADDVGRCEDNPDLGHGSGNESPGNVCVLGPFTFSLPEHIPHGVTPCTAKASNTPLWRADRFWSFCFPASESSHEMNRSPHVLSECVRSFLEAAAIIPGGVQPCLGKVRLCSPEAGARLQVRFPIRISLQECSNS